MSLKYSPKGPIDKHTSLVQVMGQFDWVNLSPAYLRNGLSVLTAKVPVEWEK